MKSAPQCDLSRQPENPARFSKMSISTKTINSNFQQTSTNHTNQNSNLLIAAVPKDILKMSKKQLRGEEDGKTYILDSKNIDWLDSS